MKGKNNATSEMFSHSYAMCCQLIVLLFFPVNCHSFCHSLVRCTISMPILFSTVICHAYFSCLSIDEAYLQSACCHSSCPFMAASFTACCATLRCYQCSHHITFLLQIPQPMSLLAAALHHSISLCWHHLTSIYFTCYHYCTTLMMASCKCRCCHHSCHQVDCWLIKYPPVRVSHWLLLFMLPAPHHCQHSCHAVESLLQSCHHCHCCCIIAIASLFLHHQ